MVRQFELVEKVQGYNPDSDEALLNRAYVYAMKAHHNQTRASGEAYISHPLEVASILSDYGLDDATIATALLHDVIEDTEATKAEIVEMFGEEIGRLVDGLTKLEKLNLVSKRAEQAENFRKLLVAISSDIRVLLVKLADRLHNMRTLEAMRPDKRQRIAQETLDIYAPLAGRMGIQDMKDELEELAFRWLNPEAYQTLIKKLANLRQRNKNIIGIIEGELNGKLAEFGIEGHVFSREKKPYSIWRKMDNKQVSLEQLSDIYGFRVMVESVADCYRVLGAVHTTWPTVPGRFKDYISTPKFNDYQSIHTTVVGPGRQRVELQIRTKKMDEIANFGVAAHAFYKDGMMNGAGEDAEGLAPFQWLRKMVANLLEGDNPEEFLEHTKLELFQDQVFCFTPKGSLIALPRGATPIDFAYAVHTNIGNSCVGVKINGRHMPLTTELKNGDEIYIITAEAQTPPPAWEKIAVTGKARSAIRRASREAIQKQYCNLGRDILQSVFAKNEKAYSDSAVTMALGRLSQRTLEDALAQVGRGELPASEVYAAVFPEEKGPAEPHKRKAIKRSDEGWFSLRRVTNLRFRWPGKTPEEHGINGMNGVGVPIRGVSGDNIAIKFSPGGAVPGERIVGILVPGEGITIYPIHSPLLKDHFEHSDRWIDVTWDIDEGSKERFPAQIRVSAMNEPGTLARIAAIIGEHDGNIDTLKMVGRREDYTRMLISLEVLDLKHLKDILAGLKGLSAVSSVERVIA